MAVDVKCPECGGVLDIEPNTVIDEPYLSPFILRGGELPRRTRTAPAALCTECEFCMEIEAPAGAKLSMSI